MPTEHEFCKVSSTLGFPGDSDGKESACSVGDSGFDSWVRKTPWEKGMATHSSTIAWRVSRAKEPDGLQSRGSHTTESDTTE